MCDRRFPIMGTGKSIPWHLVLPFEGRALKNHNQSLDMLSSRGGLSPLELWAVLHDVSFYVAQETISSDDALIFVLSLVGEDLF